MDIEARAPADGDGESRILEDMEARIRELEAQVAEQAKALEAMRLNEARLAEAERIARAGSFEWDATTDTVTWSEGLYKLYGLSHGAFEHTYQGYLDRIHPADRDRVDRVVRAAFQSMLPFEHDYRIVLSGGTIRVVRARGEVVVDQMGRPIKLRGTCQDVTREIQREMERNRVAEALAVKAVQLQQAQELARIRDHFLSSISHEMKTPLSLVIGYAELLQDQYPESDLLAGIQDGARRLSDLVGKIVDLGALLGGSLKLYKTEVEIPEIVRFAVAAVEPQCGGRNIAVVEDMAQGLPPVEADSRRLVQMLVELLENAVKFSPDGGVVRVEARVADGWVRICVVDEGPGIEEHALTRIFEAFHQEEIGSAMRKGGVGIGLAIVKLLAELHGGRVEVESKVGKGSRFSIVLPVGAYGQAEHGLQEGPGL